MFSVCLLSDNIIKMKCYNSLAVSADFEIKYGQLRNWKAIIFILRMAHMITMQLFYSNAVFVYVLDQQSNAQ